MQLLRRLVVVFAISFAAFVALATIGFQNGSFGLGDYAAELSVYSLGIALIFQLMLYGIDFLHPDRIAKV